MIVDDEMPYRLEVVLDVSQRLIKPFVQTVSVRTKGFAFEVSRQFEHVDTSLEKCQEDVQLTSCERVASKAAEQVCVGECRGKEGWVQLNEEVHWKVVTVVTGTW